MTFKEIRLALDKTQAEFAQMLTVVEPQMDAYLISKIENGIVYPTPTMQEYAEKVLASSLAARKEIDSVIHQEDDRRLLKGVLEAQIYNLLLKSTKPISRAEMCYMTKSSDRYIRRSIEDMRRKGIRVISSSNSGGYKLAQSDIEYEIFEREYTSRAYKLLQNAKAMRLNTTGQIKL